jgi:hypothetical protein
MVHIVLLEVSMEESLIEELYNEKCSSREKEIEALRNFFIKYAPVLFSGEELEELVKKAYTESIWKPIGSGIKEKRNS